MLGGGGGVGCICREKGSGDLVIGVWGQSSLLLGDGRYVEIVGGGIERDI